MCVGYFLDLGKLLIYLSLPPKEIFWLPHYTPSIYNLQGSRRLEPRNRYDGAWIAKWCT